ncbi:MAG TPA: SHOCT domain-containing protein [Capillimicrobium sp.]|nr:SHOCT domain-containing protein [Capillimicrobium sp.]
MGRRVASRTLVVAGTLLAVLAILALWVSRQALDTDEWTDTSSELLEDPAVQTAVANFLVDRLYANVDVAAELEEALPPRLDPIAPPAAGALRRGAEDLARRALDRPRVQEAWEEANRAAHATLVDVVEGGGDVVSTDQGTVALDLRALVAQIAERTGIGGKVADRLPEGAATIVILRSDQLDTVQTIGKLLKPLALVLVLLMLAAFAAAIALARGRRRETLRGAGIGLVFAGAVALVVRALAGDVVVDALATTAAAREPAESVWRIGTSLLAEVAWATIAYGIIVVIGAWLAGPTRAAVGIRRGLAPYLRSAELTYGVVAAVVLLILLWGPTQGTRRVLPTLVLLALLVAGVEVLRRQARREFPDAVRGPGVPGAAAVARAVDRAREARATPRPAGTDGGDGTTVTRPAVAEEDRIAQLERLTALHDAGALDDAEFTEAKHRVLEHV